MSNIVSIKPQSKKRKKSVRKRIIFIVLAVLVVAGMGIGAYYYLQSRNKTDDNKPEAQEVRLDTVRIESAEEVQKRLDDSSDDKEKVRLYDSLSIAEQRNGNIEQAIQAQQKSIDVEPTHSAYATMAALYRQQGDTSKAIEMYKKAMELTEKTEDPNLNTPYNNYRLQLNELEGSI